jgi:hypothetical protein
VTFSRPKESGRYFAAVFDRVGYAVRGHVDVNVHPRLVASASLDTITVGESSELRVVKTGGSQAMSVSWYPSDTLDYPAEWRPVATPLETTVYTARVRTLDNLDTEASVRVTVLPPP